MNLMVTGLIVGSYIWQVLKWQEYLTGWDVLGSVALGLFVWGMLLTGKRA